MIVFPQGFLWGAATSAHQVEGENRNNDWWKWERSANLKETSGSACRHYQLFKEDFDLARSLNHNCHRFSIEWSRIFPSSGAISREELTHYRNVIQALKERGLEPIVSLHHFTNPLWFSKLGGWENPGSQGHYLNYVRRVVEEFADLVKYWVTINEPMVYVYYSYVIGAWPPQEKSFLKARRVTANLISAHTQAYKLIQVIYRNKGLPKPEVGIAKNMQAFVPCKNNFRNRLAVYLRDKSFNFDFLNKLAKSKTMDFIGVNYYTRSLVETSSWSLNNVLTRICQDNHSSLLKNSLGWDIYPEGLVDLLLRLKIYDLPVIILENGICTMDDALRWNFINQHLKSIGIALAKGVRISGYIYWSLLDNFEWDKGFGPRFGLIGVDYSDFRRTVRESARIFSLVCKTGILEQ
ncbi:MAG: glycoside hydrolase family 1 protein [Candidatus Omnitrophota bacterium]|nr:glycoside hydrolase family 1 protein [Candidatus Omnitrophota bacterium]MBU1929715.1 glycoside hydrolase family 1 protein [Candidatus Omnitrophota bacterium]MBU2035113.1 glycoside hydrolase family 1 protein [Candidatus Omnitrophota bacterium]MBU2220996.1 glycoside hydrolase family 1 protein [Candidatus Omnitrophota bacterium]MBU2258730.1 glycoside hydrolase family 1 protein [Candidatus Omnitrophota bacterium]